MFLFLHLMPVDCTARISQTNKKQFKLPVPSQAAHEEFPDKFILYTEACAGERPLDPAVALGSWGRGERYLNNIIEDLNHWAVGWTDWNMALDMEARAHRVAQKLNSKVA